MSDVVVLGAGPAGLATAILLAKDGHEVTVLEKDAASTPATADEAWDRWDRNGVGQFRSAHYVHAKLRHLLDAELPEVRDELLATGGRRHNLIGGVGYTITDPSPRPGDERFETITGRRPVIEGAFARVAENTPGVKILRGVAADGPVSETVRDGVPHIAGVRTRDGDTIRSDVVVDAMGRRSKVVDWVAAAGGRPPYEEATDAGFVYYTRHYRSRDGSLPEVVGSYFSMLSTFSVLTLPTDGDTWVVVLVCSMGDALLKGARHVDTWERIVRAVPHATHWLDGEPMQDVSPMAGVLDRYRRFVVDDEPVVTGLVAVGDAWACTNPMAGRGITTGVRQAVALRDVLREHDDRRAVALAFDEITERTCTPWYRSQVDRDQARFAAVNAVIEGRDIEPPSTDSARLQAAFGTAAAYDADIVRAFLEVFSCQTLAEDVLARPGLVERVLAVAADHEPPVTQGPNREQLAALVA